MYAKHYHLSAPVLLSPIMLNQQQNNNLGEATWQSLQLKSKAFIKVNASGDPMNPPMPCNAFSSENIYFKAFSGLVCFEFLLAILTLTCHPYACTYA